MGLPVAAASREREKNKNGGKREKTGQGERVGEGEREKPLQGRIFSGIQYMI